MKAFRRRHPQLEWGVLGPLVTLALLAVHCGASDDAAMVGSPGTGGSGANGASGTGGGISDGGLEDAGCSEGDIVCEGAVAWRCDDAGGRVDAVDCSNDGQICVDGIGCATCVPGATSCSQGVGTYCTDDGTREESFVCDPRQGLDCRPEGCVGACTPLKLGRNQAGCDFWPTVTANSAWGSWFPFGVMVVNTTDEAALVVVTRGEDEVVQRALSPGGVELIELPWIEALKGSDADDDGTVMPPTHSVFSESSEGGGAYRLRSDQPVVVTQFNTLRSSDPNGANEGCPAPDSDGECLSYSNDASLLLPAHTLDSTHVLMGWRAWQLANGEAGMGDFVTITAIDDDTQVIVTPTSPTLPLGENAPLEPGEPRPFELARGDVLQLFTDASIAGAQWAGAEVGANRPVQVLTGAPCMNVPENEPTCDHIEESNLPSSMLGKRYLVMAPKSPSGRVRHVVRIHGIDDDTLVEFDPPAVHNSITVGRGEVVDLDLPDKLDESKETPDFFMSSTRTFGVTQYMVGNQADPYDPALPFANLGDPSQTFVVPTSRYLKRYAIALAPGFEKHSVDIVAATGAEVFIDEEAIPSASFRAIGASGLSVARVAGLTVSERHQLRSDKPFGVQIRGFGQFTSYMIPAGVDLRQPSQ